MGWEVCNGLQGANCNCYVLCCVIPWHAMVCCSLKLPLLYSVMGAAPSYSLACLLRPMSPPSELSDGGGRLLPSTLTARGSTSGSHTAWGSSPGSHTARGSCLSSSKLELSVGSSEACEGGGPGSFTRSGHLSIRRLSCDSMGCK